MKISFVFLFVYLSLTASSQTLVINEVMASNASTIADEDGDYTDWLELYNTSNATIDLSQYWLTDDKDEQKKWHLPAIQLLSSEHLLVFCSGKDRLSGELHTNFKISAA
ncbi:lamin tail domain-containing protein, partial [Bacteroidia bacterium]|nr:lamin tail domain-containing protein [Bacteroidia bacterium]